MSHRCVPARSRILCGIVTALVLVSGRAVATDIFPGDVGGTWTAAGAPYYVQGDIRVPPDGRLLVMPGTTVIVSGLFAVTVEGTLQVLGTADSVVTFTSGYNPNQGDWQGIRFYGPGAGGVVRNAVLQGATEAIRVETLAGADNTVAPRLEHCLFQGNNTGVFVCGNAECQCFSTITTHADPVIRRCTFRDNATGIRILGRANAAYHYPRLLGTADPVIANCVFRDNGRAIACEARAYLQWNQSGNEGLAAPVLRNLVIEGGEEGIRLEASAAGSNFGRIELNASNLVISGCKVGIRVQSDGGGTIEPVFLNTVMAACSLAVKEGGGGAHALVFRHGDLWDNQALCDGCVPSLGRLEILNSRGDSADVFLNIHRDPAFAGPPEDYHLTPASPCVDAGVEEDEDSDGCLPPGLGRPTADIGPYGGRGNCGWEGAPALRVGQVDASPGDSLTVPVLLDLPSGQECHAVQIDLNAPDERVRLIGADLTGTLAEAAGWVWQQNIEGARLRLALSGAQAIAGPGILLGIRAAIGADAAGGLAPLILASALIDAGGPELDLVDGGVQIGSSSLAASGDVDGNGLVQAYDAAQVLRFLVGSIDLTEDQQASGEVSGNGELTAWDASVIQMYVVGRIDHLPYDTTMVGTGALWLAAAPLPEGGQMVELALQTDEAASMTALQATIGYDPEVLSYISFEPGTGESGMQTATRCDAGQGRVDLALAGTARIVGRRPMGTLRFLVRPGSNDSTSVRLSSLRFDEGEVRRDLDRKTLRRGSAPFLAPPSPNPTQRFSSFNYTLAGPGPFRLDLFGVDGRLLRNLDPGVQEPGIHAMTLDCTDLATGIYYVRLSTGRWTESRTLVVCR